MSESADDNHYLSEAELAQFNASVARVEKAPRSGRAVEPDIVEIQAATARELIATDTAHESFIQQYIQFGGRFP